jgi:hypothetical protein
MVCVLCSMLHGLEGNWIDLLSGMVMELFLLSGMVMELFLLGMAILQLKVEIGLVASVQQSTLSGLDVEQAHCQQFLLIFLFALPLIVIRC